ncbi:metallophosphoesterase family protein [Nocardia sp. NPDC057668]|uniref:metallophosphoesterase family protein n=1 Tax=Nocardia sp. NPDC057668 TaxID=3346202 RepID=UPI00366DF24E
MRTVIIGDIHGCFDELGELVAKVELGVDDLLVGVGDLVDRGPQPLEVVDFFRGRPNSVALMGNHERKHVRGIFSYAQEITRLQAGAGYDEMVAWMTGLPYFFENEHVRVVHAAMVPGIPLGEQREEILCGSTRGERELRDHFPGSYWHEHYTDSKPVVFGHHVTGDAPLVRDGRVVSLDTGACHGGYLTALSLPDFTFHAVRAHTDHWSHVKGHWQLPVLRTKPWTDYSWQELDEAITRYSRTPDPAARVWLTSIEHWAADLRSCMPALVESAYATAAELDPAHIRHHPAAMFLFQTRGGKLDLASLGRQCTTPRRTIALAAALRLDVPAMPH